MHELYKVARADTDKQLYLDFKPIADKIKLAKMQELDNLTPLRRACRDGDCAAGARTCLVAHVGKSQSCMVRR